MKLGKPNSGIEEQLVFSGHTGTDGRGEAPYAINLQL